MKKPAEALIEAAEEAKQILNDAGNSSFSDSIIDAINILDAAISSAKAAEEGVEKLEHYRMMAKAMPHEQRGTDAEVNKDAVKRYEEWSR